MPIIFFILPRPVTTPHRNEVDRNSSYLLTYTSHPSLEDRYRHKDKKCALVRFETMEEEGEE